MSRKMIDMDVLQNDGIMHCPYCGEKGLLQEDRNTFYCPSCSHKYQIEKIERTKMNYTPLPGCEIIKAELDNENGLWTYSVQIRERRPHCPKCGKLANLRKQKLKKKLYDIDDKEEVVVMEIINHYKFCCTDCNTYFFPRYEGVLQKRRATNRLKDCIKKEVQNNPDVSLVELAERFRLGATTIYRILQDEDTDETES